MSYISLTPDVLPDNKEYDPTITYDLSRDTAELISGIAERLNNAESTLSLKADQDSLISQILLTEEDVLITGDKISIAGSVTFADWKRDIGGDILGTCDGGTELMSESACTGGGGSWAPQIDPRITQISGDVIRTGVVKSTNWDASNGSEINLNDGTISLGGSSSPDFSVDTAGNMTCNNATINGDLIAGSTMVSTVTIDGGTYNGNTINDAVGSAAGSGPDGTSALTTLLADGLNNFKAFGLSADHIIEVGSANVEFRYGNLGDGKSVGTNWGSDPGAVRHGVGITAAGIIMGSWANSSGTWSTNVSINASGTAGFAGELLAAGLEVNGTGNVRGGQTTYNTGTGFFLGYESSKYKFSIGNAGSNSLTWDGVNLNINGTFASGAVLADTSSTGFTATINGYNVIVSNVGQISGTSSGKYDIGVVGYNSATAIGSGVGNIGVAGVVNASNSDSTANIGGYFEAPNIGLFARCSKSTSSIAIEVDGDVNSSNDDIDQLGTGWGNNWLRSYISYMYTSYGYGYGFVAAYSGGSITSGAGTTYKTSSHLANSYFYSGTGTKLGTAPFSYFWNNGKIMGYFDALGVFYSKTNWE
jgi:hypothetical protein